MNRSVSTSASLKKVRVLCFFKAWAKQSGRTISFNDSIMIHVLKSDEIETVFMREMIRRYSRPNEHRVGPKPVMYELVSYVAENGAKEFNAYRE